MKILLAMLFLTSCTVTPRYYTKEVVRTKTAIEKEEACTYKLIQESGIEAEKAQRVCNKVFRRE